MKRILIISGGHFNLEFAKKYIKTLSFDKVFAVDQGLEYVEQLGLSPDYIVGDFDSVNENILKQYMKKEADLNHSLIERYPEKKDVTDTELAVQKAIGEKPDEIVLLSATGTRIDHSIMNMGLLIPIAEAGIKGYIIDEYNRIQLLNAENNKKCCIKKTEQYGSYLSFVPMSKIVEGVTMSGVMYPLNQVTVYQGSSLTVSNQIVDHWAKIEIQSGLALIIESKDDK